MQKKGATHGRVWSITQGSIIVCLCFYFLLHVYRRARDAADMPE
jgi:hypothetical protein